MLRIKKETGILSLSSSPKMEVPGRSEAKAQRPPRCPVRC